MAYTDRTLTLNRPKKNLYYDLKIQNNVPTRSLQVRLPSQSTT